MLFEYQNETIKFNTNFDGKNMGFVDGHKEKKRQHYLRCFMFTLGPIIDGHEMTLEWLHHSFKKKYIYIMVGGFKQMKKRLILQMNER